MGGRGSGRRRRRARRGARVVYGYDYVVVVVVVSRRSRDDVKRREFEHGGPGERRGEISVEIDRVPTFGVGRGVELFEENSKGAVFGVFGVERRESKRRHGRLVFHG